MPHFCSIQVRMLRTLVKFTEGRMSSVRCYNSLRIPRYQLGMKLQKGFMRYISGFSSSQHQKVRQQFAQYAGGSVDLLKDSESRIATILLNNPDKKNALTGKMMVDLDDAVTDLENWSEGRGVILVGAGDAFCSGGDLSTVQEICDPVNGNSMCHFMQSVTLRLLNLPLISVAAIQGPALGGGADLTVSCDFRIMKDSKSSKIGFVQSRLGVAPGWGGATKLVKLLGRTKALYLLTSGKLLDANDAFGIGLVENIYPEDRNIAEMAKKWIQENTASDQRAGDVVKTMVTMASNLNLTSSLAAERELFCKVWGSEHHRNMLTKGLKLK